MCFSCPSSNVQEKNSFKWNERSVFEFDWGEVGKRLVGGARSCRCVPTAAIGDWYQTHSIQHQRPLCQSARVPVSFASILHSIYGALSDGRALPSPPGVSPSEIARHGNEGSYVAPRAPRLVECEKCEYSWPMTIGSSWS